MAAAAGLAASDCGCLRCCLIWAACGAEDLGHPAHHSHAWITLHERCCVSQELVVRELVLKPLNPFRAKAGCKLSLSAPEWSLVQHVPLSVWQHEPLAHAD
ncbi:hypothetical protein HaLaN_19469 [Haematococcus lacustris]|uniref:Uncharacterized protein n=1 Tax=Haematococcus lacustris TaxID=44745 RepID=A0A699ZTH7_HAELA|nr:hypothetical protein HaLaN_19469 [Haematococcus lacustris]